MRKTSDEEKREISAEWLGGACYREISEKHDISTGNISKIIDEYRKTSPDVDLLRRLNVRLKKGGFTSFDALRACPFLESLNSYGIGLNGLRQYIEMCRRILSDKKLQDSAITYAVRLMQLEEKCQKPFEKVIEDFDKTVLETDRLKAENERLKLENRKLENEAENTKKKIEELYSEHAQVSTQLEKLMTASKLLQSVGPRKLLALAKFNQDFETLGYSIEQIQKLSILRQDLINMGIQPDNLKNNRIQLQSLSSQVTGLRSEVESLENNRQHLLQTQPALIAADTILQTNAITVPCKLCGESLDILLPTKQQYNEGVAQGRFLPITCMHCRGKQRFNLVEIAVQVAWVLLR